MLRNRSLLRSGVCCLVPALTLLLAAAPPVRAVELPPDAGQVADSVKERKTVVPPKAKVNIEVSPEQQNQPQIRAKKEGVKIKVSAIHITGQTLYSEDKLQAVVGDVIGQQLTVDELQTVARRIAQYFNDRGYMVANAYVPPQNVKKGVVEIAVAPGRYDGIELRNHSRLSAKVANRLLSQIKPGDYVRKDMLERTLLLVSDIGGISIHATLGPGKTPGTSKLLVEIKNDRELTSQFSWDHYGNRYTGPDRGSLRLNLNNPTGQGDMAYIGGYNSGGLNDYNLGYSRLIGNHGATLGVSFSQLHYSLEGDFERLDAGGSFKTEGIYAAYPLIRSRTRNLYALLEYNRRKINDHINQYESFTDKNTNTWTLSLLGDSQDKYHGGGINSYSLSVSCGRLAIDGGQDAFGDSVEGNDSEGLKTAGSYTKLNLGFNRLQYLRNRLNLYVGLTGQLASKNLDSSEKIYLGGANGVRAYPQGEASGDQGYILTGELRWDLPTPKVQLAAYVDTGRVTINKNPLSDADDNSRTLSGAGVGLILNSRKDYTARLDYAWKIGSDAGNSDTDKGGRWWMKVTEYF